MDSELSRRKAVRYGALVVGVGSFIGLSGCQSAFGLDDTVPVEINLLNNTTENIRPLVQLTGTSATERAYLGDGYDMAPEAAEIIELDIKPATYRLRVAIDREGPPLVEELLWEISTTECPQRSWIVLSGTDDALQASLTAHDCR